MRDCIPVEMLKKLFNEHVNIREAVEVLQSELTGKWLTFSRIHIYDKDEPDGGEEMFHRVLRDGVIALAKEIPEVVHYTVLPTIQAGMGAISEVIYGKIPFRVTIAYSLGLHTGKWYTDDEGEEQPVLEAGHQFIVDAFVSQVAI